MSFIFNDFLNKESYLLFSVLILVALAALLSERSGIINIALEGQLVSGAFGYTIFGFLTKSSQLPDSLKLICGVLVAILTTLIFTSIFSLFVIRFKMNQILTAIAFNIIATSLASFVIVSIKNNPDFILGEDYLWLYNSENLNAYLKFKIADGANVEIIFYFFVLIFIIGMIYFGLFKTKTGLRLRSCGENPKIALMNGIKINQYRLGSLLIGGVLIGIAGTIFAEWKASFSGSVDGFGYLGLIMLILGARNIFLICGFTTFFVILRTLIMSKTDNNWNELLNAFNYILPLFALVLYGAFWKAQYGKNAPPEALGK